MSEISANSEAVVQAAAEKFVALGMEAGQRMVEGKDGKAKDREARKILYLLEAYRNRASLETNEVEAILYCLYQLSDLDEMPTVVNVLKDLSFLDELPGEIVDLIIQADSVDQANRPRLNFWHGLVVSDSGTVINVGLPASAISNLVVATGVLTIPLLKYITNRFKVPIAINSATAFAIGNEGDAHDFLLFIEIGGTLPPLTMPGNFKSVSFAAEWGAPPVWQPIDTGFYKVRGDYDGTNWWVKFERYN
jgi:hypothetical protein